MVKPEINSEPSTRPASSSSMLTVGEGLTVVDRRIALKSRLRKITSLAFKLNSDPTKKKDYLTTIRLLQDMEIERRVVSMSDKQYRSYEAFKSRQWKMVACVGSNRSGKSYGGGAAYCEYLRDEAPPNSQHLCVTQSQKLSAANQQKMIWDCLPKHLFGNYKWTNPANGFHSKRPLIILDEGGRNITVYFKTQSEFEDDIASFEGLTIETAWIDESISEELFSAVMTRMANSDDGRCLISSIPSAAWMYEKIEHGDSKDVWFDRFGFKDNPTMTPEKIANLVKNIPLHEQEVRVQGKTAIAGSIVYPEFKRDHHVKRLADVPKNLTYYAGLDSGMDHPTVCLLVGVDEKNRKWVLAEHAARNETIPDTVAAMKRLFGNRQLAWPPVADPAMWQSRKMGMEAEEFRVNGMPLTMSMRTQTYGENVGVHMIKEMLSNDELFVVESCQQLIREFSIWSYKRDRMNRPLASDSYEDKNNDALDALRYLMVMNPMYQRKIQKVEVFDLNDDFSDS